MCANTKVSPLIEPCLSEPRPVSVYLASANSAAKHPQGSVMPMVGAAVAVLLDGATEFGEGENNRVRARGWAPLPLSPILVSVPHAVCHVQRSLPCLPIPPLVPGVAGSTYGCSDIPSRLPILVAPIMPWGRARSCRITTTGVSSVATNGWRPLRPRTCQLGETREARWVRRATAGMVAKSWRASWTVEGD